MRQNKIITRGSNVISNQENLSFHFGGGECFCFVYSLNKQDIRKVTVLGRFLTSLTTSGRIDLTIDIASRALLSFLRIYPFEIIDFCKLSLQRQFNLALDTRMIKSFFPSRCKVSDNPAGVLGFPSMKRLLGIRFSRVKVLIGEIDFSENIKPLLAYRQAC